MAATTWYWQSTAAEYFGRIDPATWQSEHPNPPPPRAEAGPYAVEVVESRRVVPSEGLPADVRVQAANNNLDVLRHDDGRVYLAFRSAPNHFASSETHVYVVSSEDEQHWRKEADFSLGRDLREPRLASFGGRVHLYVSRLGEHSYSFEQQGVSAAELVPGRGFTPLAPIYEPGFLAWRVRAQGNELWMIGYAGGGNLYSARREPMRVELLASRDGEHFAPLTPGHGAVLSGGGSEADFAFEPNGDLFAVVRNEAGDDDGFGSKVCHAARATPSEWHCASDPRKFDSPLTFSHGGEQYLLARRNLTADGRYDVAGGPRFLRYVRNELGYITTAKRCALWHYDRAARALRFVLDLPSMGDTCFPAIVPGASDEELIVYDYSSDVNGPELPWAAGQRRPTYIYRHVLRFQ